MRCGYSHLTVKEESRKSKTLDIMISHTKRQPLPHASAFLFSPDQSESRSVIQDYQIHRSGRGLITRQANEAPGAQIATLEAGIASTVAGMSVPNTSHSCKISYAAIRQLRWPIIFRLWQSKTPFNEAMRHACRQGLVMTPKH